MPQRRHQNNGDTDENAPQQKSKRWRGRSLPAPLPCTTKAIPTRIAFLQLLGHSPWLARVRCAVQLPAARVPSPACFRRQIIIQFEKVSIKVGVAQDRLVQRVVSFTLPGEEDKNPLEGFSQAFRGGSSFSINCRDRVPALLPQISCSRSEARFLMILITRLRPSAAALVRWRWTKART